MAMKSNMVGWFEIPVRDMERAVRFYEEVFDVELTRQRMGPADMALFPSVEDALGAAGALLHHEEVYTPSTDGLLVYFTPPSGDLANELGRVEAAGGKVLKGKTLITETIGYYGLFTDTEGNRVAIHSRK